jgi:hypothetical protein
VATLNQLRKVASKYNATILDESGEDIVIYVDSSTHLYDGSHTGFMGLGDTKSEAYADSISRLQGAPECDGCDDKICHKRIV